MVQVVRIKHEAVSRLGCFRKPVFHVHPIIYFPGNQQVLDSRTVIVIFVRIFHCDGSTFVRERVVFRDRCKVVGFNRYLALLASGQVGLEIDTLYARCGSGIDVFEAYLFTIDGDGFPPFFLGS